MGFARVTATKRTPDVTDGFDRSHERSVAQKGVFVSIHALSLFVCVFIALGGHVPLLGWPAGWRVVDPVRADVVVAVTALYAVRLTITLVYLLQRRFGWFETLGLGLTVMVFEIGCCLLAAGLTRGVPVAPGWVDAVAISLVLAGSYLNTYSEMQRKWWKDRPENRGRCYTRGLFSWSRHINYFGDCVLFSGWCLLAATRWMLAVPACMALMFVFYHIPHLESYLESRYGDEFRDYEQRTKRFIPLLY